MKVVLILALFVVLASSAPAPYEEKTYDKNNQYEDRPYEEKAPTRQVRASPAPGPLKSKDDLDAAGFFYGLGGLYGGYGYGGYGYGYPYGYSRYGYGYPYSYGFYG